MEHSTTIRKMFAGNQIIVPTYQRAYAWDVDKQVNVFLSDLEQHLNSRTGSDYYFGHFLFEDKGDSKYHVVDGQQRISTIVVFCSTLFDVLKSKKGNLSDNELDLYEDLIKRRENYRFETVDYDRQAFKDYIIDQKKDIRTEDLDLLETESLKRVIKASKFFKNELNKKSVEELSQLLDVLINATCSTHTVKNEAEAIQMFIFQNNRGKKPSNLENLKAQFMFYVHLYAGEKVHSLNEEIKARFETIYRAISAVEGKIGEDDVLRYASRIYFHSFNKDTAKDLDEALNSNERIEFIQKFSLLLAECFTHLKTLYLTDSEKNQQIHSLLFCVSRIGIAMPFILKSYLYGLNMEDKEQLAKALESILLRHTIIGTRADLEARLQEVFKNFKVDNKTVLPIIERIDYLKKVTSEEDWWCSYWNDGEFGVALGKGFSPSMAKLLLLKYESHLLSLGKQGYSIFNYNKDVVSPEVEHISPVTERNEKVASGYGRYDEEFINSYLNCLGNYLIVSKSHNCSIGNKAFKEKLKTYEFLAQQREINDFIDKNKQKWTRKEIKARNQKIISFLLENL